ncbi:hypothetical protein [Qipengyuania oceanensis]|uniref:Uncharacterized protein n=1 Tax=Qipengyuania oceanensis TaxID=1463597 RepID=A0A844YBM6_9SPHN|nr:hypothetical protein [Qipengyuania oceanensis]MXO61397.1 hypothetical protein [Qipengyuania oceanensis]
MTFNDAGAIPLQHRPSLTVRELDHLDYLAKIRHWLRDDAWNPGGTSLRFENPDYRVGDLIVVDGNITKAKPLVGRPCFGIATALLRYEYATRYVKGRGAMPAGRCHTCKAKDACRWVVTNRLKSVPSLERSWTSWLQEGGPSMFSMPNYKGSGQQRSWVELCRELRQVHFTSANDQHVATAYAEKDRIAREKDKERQAQNRRRARRNGEIDEFDEELLKKAAIKRAVALVEFRKDPECPRVLSRLPQKSLKELLEVWLGREILRAMKTKDNAPSIARWIARTGRSNTSKNHSSLSSRVAKDLQRIEKLERAHWRNEILLPPLDRQNEFPSGG